ncbi:hypothetical protein A3F58_00580 [Candidatus Roizmanbacteria bacterium RIFCSPHIGHO2_12_FULL_37_9b]|uniref:Uncharacterized protein n=1 Tax=Candidatus Roizmanbacteria bacterium RIFCSPHIGHO2_02_FULL_38_11 TaxID=1802039 RepID=A0A1F7GXJ8_9BACT|nr:MAG: hypothetical protein A3C25_01205 [Candidatus Roizmanbacteria bacterium RIFCSPHIGHO2_02_FULL_38_11]OGK33904.1 MAG: hypothetical protein A3F58_00580 [Candidatus Roizmanbacteria bacterium RIFCSPHIGHO2_12_FULL_37_9b]
MQDALSSNYYIDTFESTNDYNKKVEVADVKPKKTLTPRVIWITPDSIPMRVLISLAQTKSPEIVTSKLDYK